MTRYQNDIAGTMASVCEVMRFANLARFFDVARKHQHKKNINVKDTKKALPARQPQVSS
jgi:hypothetical protein